MPSNHQEYQSLGVDLGEDYNNNNGATKNQVRDVHQKDDNYLNIAQSDNDKMKDKRIHVYLRLRPMNKLEASRRSRDCIEVHNDNQTLTVDSPLEGEYEFSFDRVSFKNYSSIFFWLTGIRLQLI